MKDFCVTLIQYSEYLVSIADIDGLVLFFGSKFRNLDFGQHIRKKYFGISRHNAEYSSMHFQQFMG